MFRLVGSAFTFFLLSSTGASGPVQSWNVAAVPLGFFQVDAAVALSGFRRCPGDPSRFQ